MRNGSLWSDKVFEKEVIFPEFDIETSDLEFEVSKSSEWKQTTLFDKGVFSFIIISQLRRPIELKFSRVCYFMHYVEKHQLWRLVFDQLPIVSSVFNNMHKGLFYFKEIT